MIDWEDDGEVRRIKFMDSEGLDELRRKPVQPDMFRLGEIVKEK